MQRVKLHLCFFAGEKPVASQKDGAQGGQGEGAQPSKAELKRIRREKQVTVGAPDKAHIINP